MRTIVAFVPSLPGHVTVEVEDAVHEDLAKHGLKQLLGDRANTCKDQSDAGKRKVVADLAQRIHEGKWSYSESVGGKSDPWTRECEAAAKVAWRVHSVTGKQVDFMLEQQEAIDVYIASAVFKESGLSAKEVHVESKADTLWAAVNAVSEESRAKVKARIDNIVAAQKAAASESIL